MTHTIHEAKQLECRQAFHVEMVGNAQAAPGIRPSWDFPKCSADKCGHWHMEVIFEDQWFERANEKIPSEVNPHAWNNKREPFDDYAIRVEAMLADGWKAICPVEWKKDHGVRSIRLRRELPALKKQGRCGLIAETYVEVSTS